MKCAAEVLLLTSSIFLLGCGSNTNPTLPVVAAQSSSNLQDEAAQVAYSDSDVTGPYSVALAGYTSSGDYTELIGSFAANGKGSISSGKFTQYGTDDNLTGKCTVTFTGAYSVTSNASGTGSITAKSTGLNGCTVSGKIQFNIQAAQQGGMLLVAESDGNGLLHGTASKQ